MSCVLLLAVDAELLLSPRCLFDVGKRDLCFEMGSGNPRQTNTGCAVTVVTYRKDAESVRHILDRAAPYAIRVLGGALGVSLKHYALTVNCTRHQRRQQFARAFLSLAPLLTDHLQHRLLCTVPRLSTGQLRASVLSYPLTTSLLIQDTTSRDLALFRRERTTFHAQTSEGVRAPPGPTRKVRQREEFAIKGTSGGDAGARRRCRRLQPSCGQV